MESNKTTKNKSVLAIFHSREEVEAGVDGLRSAGFRHSDISVLMPELGDTLSFGHEKATKAPEGAATGATSGAVIGGTLGWLVGIGSLAIPGVGPFIAAGPIMAALAGMGIGAGVGGVAGGLVGMGIPEYEAKRYERLMKGGGILLSVHVDDGDWQKRAEKILETYGATDISTSSEDDADHKSVNRERVTPVGPLV